MTEQTKAVTITHGVPATMIVLAPDVVSQVNKLRLAYGIAKALEITDDTVARETDDTITLLKKMRSAIEKDRKTVKAPVIDIGRQIDAAAKPVVDELKTMQDELANKVLDYQTEQSRIAAVAAAKEQARLDEIHRKEEVARRAQADADAAKLQLKLDQDKAKADAFGDDEKPPPPPPPPPKPAPAPRAAPKAVAVQTFKGSVHKREVKTLVITDESLIPSWISPSQQFPEGMELKQVNKENLKKALLHGWRCAGAHLDTETKAITK